MEFSTVKLQTKLMKDYYKWFSKYSKGKRSGNKVAWVTSFAPIEILEALKIDYYYPESYAAVIAASEKEQTLLQESELQFLSKDCCSYSCCFNGCIDLEQGPRGVPPMPDILIATNNQCNTLPNWWNVLAQKYNIPLIVIDYPGEYVSRDIAYSYVKSQHENLIKELEIFSGNKFDEQYFLQLINNSKKSIENWKKIVSLLAIKEIEPTVLFDGISFLITSRCKEETGVLYELMYDENLKTPDYSGNDIPIFWLGYPLWYHPKRYLVEALDGMHIVGTNYVTWWSLNYEGDDMYEILFNAYNYTFLNLKQSTRTEILTSSINASHAKAAISLHNKSCKCDFVSAKDIGVPQVELEIDMIDREYMDIQKAKQKIGVLKDIIS